MRDEPDFFLRTEAERRADARKAEAAHAAERQRRIGRAVRAVELEYMPVTTQIRAWIGWLVDDSLTPTPYRIEWITRESRAERLMRGPQGVACYQERTIVIAPLTNEDHFLTAVHEAGHLRTKRGTTIASEISAWDWAMTHSPLWTRPMHEGMTRSLHTYLATAKHPDILDVLRAERLCSEERWRRERQRRVELEIAAECQAHRR